MLTLATWHTAESYWNINVSLFLEKIICGKLQLGLKYYIFIYVFFDTYIPINHTNSLIFWYHLTTHHNIVWMLYVVCREIKIQIFLISSLYVFYAITIRTIFVSSYEIALFQCSLIQLIWILCYLNLFNVGESGDIKMTFLMQF